MKAVVVEIKGRFVAVLSDDGCISKIKNKNYIIGQEIILKNNLKYIKIAASSAACLMLFITPVWAYLTPYSYVSLDINPSFEFSINRFDRVLQVNAINDDGRDTVEHIDISKLKNKEIGEAVKNVLTELKGQGYLNNADEDGVVVAASSKSQEKTDKLASALKLAVEEEINIKSDDEELIITREVNKEGIEKAVKNEKSNETEKFNDDNEKIKEENNEIKEQKKEEKGTTKEEKASIEDKEKKKEEKSEIKNQNNETENEIKNKNTDAKDGIKGQNQKETEEKKKDEQKVQKAQNEDNNKNNRGKKDNKDKITKEFRVEIIEVSKEAIDKAKNNGVTPGKMELIEKLQSSAKSAGKSIDTEQWFDKSVKDIMEKTKEYEKSAKREEKNNKKDDKSNKKDDSYNNKKDKTNERNEEDKSNSKEKRD
ncbi:hypothetical protein [Sedimentibacter sp.]|uniref:anti-sigma-I factor RsgI family protein n=1 Tax=Sedimentibacter sp. TaxID=1960295 RepID=UPI0028B04197|nr:hypothetical protein [Sedimentibacter sp.]